MPSSARRLELYRRLAQLAPRTRADAMLEEVDGKALVPTLPAEDVYRTIVEVGLADSTELVQLATPRQFQSFVDLAAWQKDRLDPIEVLHWIRAARGDDDASFAAKVEALDVEVVELLYKRLARIHDLEEDPDVDPAGVTMETPEGKFLVEFTVDGVDEAAMRRLTFDLMARSPFELTRFLEAVRWESDTELEEAAFQFRSARLADLGFPPLEEAMKVFAWVDPASLAPPLPTPGLTATSHVDFVGASFKGLDDDERDTLATEIRGLVNSVLVAEGAEPGDPRAIRVASERARDYLDLGLEHLTGADPARATEVVREHPLRTIFQVGFSLTLNLKRSAERLLAEPRARFADTVLALDEEQEVLKGLLLKRPLKVLKVPGADMVPFRSRRELFEAEQALERIRAQRGVLWALLGDSPVEVLSRFGVPLSELKPQRLLAAAVGWAELDGRVTVAPLPEDRLAPLLEALFVARDGTAVATPAAGRRAIEALSGLLLDADAGAVEAMVQRVLLAIAADLGPRWARDGKVDPPRVSAVPVAGHLPV